jgi:hypothetical protein
MPRLELESFAYFFFLAAHHPAVTQPVPSAMSLAFRADRFSRSGLGMLKLEEWRRWLVYN